MMHRFRTIGAHWYSRQSTLKENTLAITEFLKKLKDYDNDLFGKWYQKAGNKKEASAHEIDLSYLSIKQLIGESNEDDYPEISHKASMWNGKKNDGDIASLSMSLGSSESRLFTNNCVLKMPYEGLYFDYYQNTEKQSFIIELMKNHWNPEWVAVDGQKI